MSHTQLDEHKVDLKHAKLYDNDLNTLLMSDGTKYTCSPEQWEIIKCRMNSPYEKN